MFRSFYVGLLQAIRLWKMGLLMMVVSLLMAIPLVLPIFWLVQQTTRNSEMAERMMGDQIDLLWLTDLINHQFAGQTLESVGGQVVISLWMVGLLYLLMHTLLTGGVLSVLIANDRRFRMWDFWAGCGHYFWRFFRLLLISRLVYGLLVVVAVLWLASLSNFESVATAQTTVIHRQWATGIVLLLLLSLVSMIFDYARIGTVVNNSSGMFRQTLRAIRFSFRHLLSTVTLYLMVAVVGLAGFAGLVALRGQIRQAGVGGVLLAFFVGQVAISLRLWHRVWFLAAEIELFRRIGERKAPSLELCLPPAPEPEAPEAGEPESGEPGQGEPAKSGFSLAGGAEADEPADSAGKDIPVNN